MARSNLWMIFCSMYYDRLLVFPFSINSAVVLVVASRFAKRDLSWNGSAVLVHLLDETCIQCFKPSFS